MKLIKWKPVKQSQVSAIKNHGDLWQFIRADALNTLITSIDGKDLRWISNSQITAVEEGS